MKLETDVEKEIERLANARGFKVYHIQGKNPSDDGVPDLLLINKHGLHYFIEAKHSTNLRVAQRMFLAICGDSYMVKLHKGELLISSAEDNFTYKLSLDLWLEMNEEEI